MKRRAWFTKRLIWILIANPDILHLLNFSDTHFPEWNRRRWLTLSLLVALTPLVSGFDWFRKKEAPEPAEDDVPVITQVQIFLDQSHFGPGKIDGALGQFTRQAVDHYNLTQGREEGNWYWVLREAQKQVGEPFREYEIQAQDFKYVGPLPEEPAEQEKLDYMPYRSVAEFVAERFHTDRRFLGKLNQSRNLDLLKTGDVVTVPNVSPFRIESVARYHKFEEAAGLSQRVVVVDTENKCARIYEGQELVASFPITPGQEQFIPYGEWKLVNMVTTPEFRWDKKMLDEGERGEEFFQLPPGPNSPVGILWAGLSKSGIGLHGTHSPETIGRSRSAGCIRLANWDAVRLSDLVRPGAAVTVK